MLPARDLYKIVLEAYEKELGTEFVDDVFNGNELFFIDDSLYDEDGTEKVLLIFTNKFVLRVEQTIDLGDIHKESGSWTKEYEAINVTKGFSGYSNYVFNKDIMKWITENALKFI